MDPIEHGIFEDGNWSWSDDLASATEEEQFQKNLAEGLYD